APRPRLAGIHPARAVAGEDEADRVRAQLARQAHVADAGHAADLDPGPEQGAAHLDRDHHVTSAGRPHSAGYSGPRNTRPEAGAVGPATVRSRPSSKARTQPSPASPRPTHNRLPTMLRTMWWRKALACTSTTTRSPSRATAMRCSSRRACGAWHCT